MNNDGNGRTSLTVAAIDELAGVIVVVVALIGLVVMTVILVTAAGTDNNTRASIGAAAVGVIGTIVGAFFGVKSSTDARKTAETARRESDIKAEELMRVVEPEQGRQALQEADTRIQRLRG